MRNGLLASLFAVALAFTLGCGDGKEKAAADSGAAPNKTPPAGGGEDPGKGARPLPQPVPTPNTVPKTPQAGDSKGSTPGTSPNRPPTPDVAKKPPIPQQPKVPPVDAREQILKDLEKLPVGIKVVHTPAKLKASRNDGSKTNIDKKWAYEWSYKTTISAVDKPLDIVRFGQAEWIDGKWAIPVGSEDHDVILGGGPEFAEWYNCPKGHLEPGKEIVDPINWSGSKTLRTFKQKWFFIGKDKDGKFYKGEADIELLGELDDGKAKGKDDAKKTNEPPKND